VDKDRTKSREWRGGKDGGWISLVAFRHDLKGSMWRLVLLLLVMHKGRDCLK